MARRIGRARTQYSYHATDGVASSEQGFDDWTNFKGTVVHLPDADPLMSHPASPRGSAVTAEENCFHCDVGMFVPTLPRDATLNVSACEPGIDVVDAPLAHALPLRPASACDQGVFEAGDCTAIAASP